MGAPRHGQLLGISGSLAFAGSVDFRYGDLSDAVCRVSDAAVPVVFDQLSRSDGRPGGGHRLRGAEYRGRESGFDDFAVAVLCALRTVRVGGGSCAAEIRRTVSRGNRAYNFES